MHATAYPSVSSTTMEPAPIIATEVSFEELYRREYPALVAVATALAGTPADGEDVVQDTMVKLQLAAICQPARSDAVIGDANGEGRRRTTWGACMPQP